MTNIAKKMFFETSSHLLDATTFLNSIYKEIINLFGEYECAQSIADKQKIAAALCSTLKTTMQLEEDIFYPAIKRVVKERGIISAATMEHSILKYLISEIESLDADSAVYDIKIRVLGGHIRQLIKEKQNKLFPKVNTSGKLDLWELGSQLMHAKKKFSLGWR